MGVALAPLEELPELSRLLCRTAERGRVEAAEVHLASPLPSLVPLARRGVPGALFPAASAAREQAGASASPKEGGRGGQSLPELGRGSLPEENQLSRQLSQLEYWRAVAARVRQDGSSPPGGSRATETQGCIAPW